LANNNKLKYFSIQENKTITSTGWGAFSRCLANPNSSLEELDLRGSYIDDEGATAFANALVNDTKLKYLNLSDARLVSAQGWRNFFNLLLGSNSAIQLLIFTGNNIGDEGLASMADALGRMGSLKLLHLGSTNQSTTAASWMPVSNFLQHPNCSLKLLYIVDHGTGNNINDEGMIGFANALAKNLRLERLEFTNTSDITPRGWAALSTVLCDKSSIDSIYESNHTLQEIGKSARNIPSDLVSFLRSNRNNNKVEVAREKIIQQHFSKSVNNIQDFLEMELEVLPHAISWIGRDGTGFPLLYHLVQSMPSLLFNSDSEAKGAGTKRKRIGIC